MTLALSFSVGAHAVGIGSATLLSGLGEPLHVAVPLFTERGEKLTDDCLSLLAPTADEAERASYLTKAELALKHEHGQLYADIRTRRTFNELFAYIRLRVGCHGKGSVSKTLIILPDLNTSAAPPATAAPPVAAAARPAPIMPPSPAPHVTTLRLPHKQPPSRTQRPMIKRLPEQKSAAIHAEQTDAAFVFKLSLNLAVPAMTAQSPVQQPPARHDDTVLLRLDPLAEQPPVEHAAAIPAPTTVATTEITEQLDNRNLQRTLAIVGLLLSLLIPLFGYRYFSRRHKQRPTTRSAPALHIATGHDHNKQASSEHSTLEEAELYAIHGHPDKAIALLQEIVRQQPAYQEAWLLLFSIYSAHGRKRGFANTAQTFHRQHPGSTSWPMIQALGRTLEPDNPLYAGSSRLGVAAPFLPHIALSKRRPIGSILVDMGLLTEQDVEIYLADFDPVRHGRFGNYLVSRRQISHAQLNEALFKQQQEEASIPNLPTLQDMESFLADFDPKRDGSIGEFLLARKAITPAQLNKVQQHETALGDSVQALDFHTPAAGQGSDKPAQ